MVHDNTAYVLRVNPDTVLLAVDNTIMDYISLNFSLNAKKNLKGELKRYPFVFLSWLQAFH